MTKKVKEVPEEVVAAEVAAEMFKELEAKVAAEEKAEAKVAKHEPDISALPACTQAVVKAQEKA